MSASTPAHQNPWQRLEIHDRYDQEPFVGLTWLAPMGSPLPSSTGAESQLAGLKGRASSSWLDVPSPGTRMSWAPKICGWDTRWTSTRARPGCQKRSWKNYSLSCSNCTRESSTQSHRVAKAFPTLSPHLQPLYPWEQKLTRKRKPGQLVRFLAKLTSFSPWTDQQLPRMQC